MPICLAGEVSRPVVALAHNSLGAAHGPVLRRLARRRQCSPKPRLRGFATAETPADSGPTPLTLLHKTKALLPRILPSEPSSQSLALWDDVLETVHADLSSARAGTELKARMVVYGCDELSGASQLVTALLDDPFTSDPSQSRALHDRHPGSTEVDDTIIIEYASAGSPRSLDVRIKSAWLQQFPVPVQITELASSSDEHRRAKALITADIPVIVFNPVTQPLHAALTRVPPAALPDALVVANSSSDSPTLRARVSALLDHLVPAKPATQDWRILFVDPSRALGAVEALKTNPGSPSAVQRYQDDFLGSRLSLITKEVSATLSSPDVGKGNVPPAVVISRLRASKALSVIRGALSTCRAAVSSARTETNAVRDGVSALEGQVAEASAKVHWEVLGVAEAGVQPARSLDRVGEATELATKEMKVTLDRMVWWKLLYKVDETGWIVTTAVDRAWCRELEQQLILDTGRLSSLQQSLTTSTQTFLSRFAAHSTFHSSLLQNSLAQLSSAPSYALTTTSLTAPLHTRKAQLSFPTTRLHVAAQRVVLGFSGSVATGVGLGYAGWAGVLSSGPLAAFGGMEGGTAAGIGMVCALAGARWAVGRWERAKRVWWEDWRRVGEGLRRDLKANLDRTMREQVAAVPLKASSELSKLVEARNREIDELDEQLGAVERELEAATEGKRTTLQSTEH